MGLYRALLIGITIIIAAYFLFTIDIWAGQYKNLFAYMNDWRSWIMLGALVYSVEGIIKWLLNEEVVVTRPRRRR